MSRKGENIYKRKDGRWEGRYIKTRTTEGKAIYGYTYAKTYHGVKQNLILCKTQNIRTESVSSPDQVEKDPMNFGELSEMWLNSIHPQVKDSTYNKYKNLLESYILPVYQKMNPAKMTHDKLQSFAVELLNSGGQKATGLSAKTVSDIFSVIKSIMQHAGNYGVVFPCNCTTICIRRKEKELRILSQAELTKLTDYLMEDLSNIHFGILLCIFTGLRIGEICALKWEDISLRNGSLLVHATLQRIQCPSSDSEKKTKIVITTPKSSCSIRSIPLMKEMLEVISANFSGQHGYVLTGEEDNFVEPRTLENHFKRILEINSISLVNFHVLRHTFATRCVEAGFDIKSLSEILGHSSVNITLNRYVHPSMQLKRENMERLSGTLSVRQS